MVACCCCRAGCSHRRARRCQRVQAGRCGCSCATARTTTRWPSGAPNSARGSSRKRARPSSSRRSRCAPPLDTSARSTCECLACARASATHRERKPASLQSLDAAAGRAQRRRAEGLTGVSAVWAAGPQARAGPRGQGENIPLSRRNPDRRAAGRRPAVPCGAAAEAGRGRAEERQAREDDQRLPGGATVAQVTGCRPD